MGNRCFFIIALRDKFIISFDEAFQMTDIVPQESAAIVKHQFGEKNKRICFQRINNPKTPCAHFSIEVRDTILCDTIRYNTSASHLASNAI